MSESPQSRNSRLADFEATVAAYEGALLRYATHILNNPTAGQDVVQETFIRLFRNWREAFQPGPRLSTWLYRVAHNCAVDYLRRENRLQLLHLHQAAETEETVPPDRGKGFGVSEKAERAANALRTLSMRERQLVILKVYEEKSYREIGEISGLTIGNVGYILHHAMRKLAAAIRRDQPS